MDQKLTPSTALLLAIPPLLWAGNAVVGRLVIEIVPPLTLNFLRWTIAMLILMPVGKSIYRRGSGFWAGWKRYSLLGLLGVGLYNSLQYFALHTSTPVNVTLIAASMPVWMLVIGRVFFSTAIARKQVIGAALSIIGVVLILARGDWMQLRSFQFAAGDLLMIVATIAFAFYSWLLTNSKDPAEIRRNWATFLLAQVTFGVLWSGLFAASEWALTAAHIDWGWPLAAALAYVAIGPAVVAFRCWGVGVQRVGPSTAGFFSNLAPLFAALMSLTFLGEMPQIYHGVAFVLIVFGIVFSSRP